MKSRAKRPTIAAERVFLRMAGSVRIGFPPAVLEAGARIGKRGAPRRGWFRRWGEIPGFSPPIGNFRYSGANGAKRYFWATDDHPQTIV
jgi:hypothetical protein